jgi:transcriptional regulator with XRE-family HTH domain
VEDLRAALGERVRELRERRDWSQEKLAERANLDTAYISGIERGRRNPGLNTLFHLARAFDLPLPVFLTDLKAPRARDVRRGRPRKRTFAGHR